MKLELISQKTEATLFNKIDMFLAVRAQATAKAYRYKYKYLCTFLGGEWGTLSAENLMLDITHEKALEFLNDHAENGIGQRSRIDGTRSISPNSVRQMIITCRSLYSHLIELGLFVGKNPFPKSLLKLYKADGAQKKPTNMVPYDQVRILLEWTFEPTKIGIRDKALIHMLFASALRVSEISHLRLSNLTELDEGLSLEHVKTKGGGEISKLLPDWANEPIRKLIAQRRAEGARYNDFVFIGYTVRGNLKMRKSEIMRLTRFQVNNIFKNILNRVGLDPHQFSCHSARATCITRLLDSGLTHREVQQFSGNKSVRMVEYYDKKRGSNKKIGKKLKY